MTPIILSRAALLVVDAQQGFTSLCPAELPVPGGVEIVPLVNRLLEMDWARIDASQDWHPSDHCSFLGRRDNLYPPHCVMGTVGAEFLPGLRTERFQTIWRKGYNRDFEAYAVTAQHPGFVSVMRLSSIDAVIVCGIATNICCYFAARDTAQRGLSCSNRRGRECRHRRARGWINCGQDPSRWLGTWHRVRNYSRFNQFWTVTRNRKGFCLTSLFRGGHFLITLLPVIPLMFRAENCLPTVAPKNHIGLARRSANTTT